MPKIYYRCNTCHKKLDYILLENIPNPVIGICSLHGQVYAYGCQHDYWYELLYLSLKGIYIAIRETIKCIWRIIII